MARPRSWTSQASLDPPSVCQVRQDRPFYPALNLLWATSFTNGKQKAPWRRRGLLGASKLPSSALSASGSEGMFSDRPIARPPLLFEFVIVYGSKNRVRSRVLTLSFAYTAFPAIVPSLFGSRPRGESQGTPHRTGTCRRCRRHPPRMPIGARRRGPAARQKRTRPANWTGLAIGSGGRI